MGLHQTTSKRNGPTCTIIGRAARSDPWVVASYATAVCQTSDSQYTEESGSSYCGRWWLHTLLTVIVLSLLSFCLVICHYVISLRYISFHPCICLHRSINWLLKTVIVYTDLVFTFSLIACVTVPAVQKVEICGPWGWVLWKTTITHQACPFLSNFAETTTLSHCLSQQVLYFLLSTLVLTLYIDVVLSLSIANFDGGTRCVIWGCNMHLHEKYQLQAS